MKDKADNTFKNKWEAIVVMLRAMLSIWDPERFVNVSIMISFSPSGPWSKKQTIYCIILHIITIITSFIISF